MSPQELDPHPKAILTGLLQGDAVVQRRSMAKAITLLESSRADHRVWADDMLTQLGWRVGDELQWIDNKDGSWTLTQQTPTL